MNGRYKKKRHYRISLLHVAERSPVCLIKKKLHCELSAKMAADSSFFFGLQIRTE